MTTMRRGCLLAAAILASLSLPLHAAGPLTQAAEVEGVEATLLEARRGEGDTVMVKWQLENKSAQKKTVTDKRSGWYDPYRLTGDAYLLDLRNRTKYPVVRTPDKAPVSAKYGAPNQFTVIEPHKKVALWAKFNAPPADVTTVEVHLPAVSLPFEGVELK